MPISNMFKRKSENHKNIEYVEFFDGLNDDGMIGVQESNEQRLQAIWRDEKRSNEVSSPISKHVQEQEWESANSRIDSTGNKIHSNITSHASRTLPTIMHEHVINTKNQFNKVFASTFITDDIVTFGTKDNKLMLLDVTKGKICQIRLPNPEKSSGYNKKWDSINTSEADKNCGIHDVKYNSNTNMLISGGYHPQDVSVFKYDDDIHHIGPKKFSHNLVPIATLRFHKDWVFSMDFIDDKHIAIGGKDGQLSIWDISKIEKNYESYRNKYGLKCFNKPYGGGYTLKEEDDNNFHDFIGFGEYEPPRHNQSQYNKARPELTQSLLGHSYEDENLPAAQIVKSSINSNKSSSLKQTTISQDRCNVPLLKTPVHFINDKNHKIRSLKAFSKSNSLSHSQCVVSLATDGQVKIYDVNRQKTIFSEYVPHKKESVTVTVNQERGQIIVGSQGHIQIFDPRSKMSDSLLVIDSLDKNWGCRTVSCNDDIITIGGGLGRLSFYDMRTFGYLDCKLNNKKIKEIQTTLKYRTMEKGWIKQDDVYNNVFVLHGLPTPSAIYTHCYNPSRSKLFAAGGPTPYGLFGSAASVYF